jgi:hypothetical protein
VAGLDLAGQAEKRERFPSLSHRVLE